MVCTVRIFYGKEERSFIIKIEKIRDDKRNNVVSKFFVSKHCC